MTRKLVLADEDDEESAHQCRERYEAYQRKQARLRRADLIRALVVEIEQSADGIARLYALLLLRRRVHSNPHTIFPTAASPSRSPNPASPQQSKRVVIPSVFREENLLFLLSGRPYFLAS